MDMRHVRLHAYLQTRPSSSLHNDEQQLISEFVALDPSHKCSINYSCITKNFNNDITD